MLNSRYFVIIVVFAFFFTSCEDEGDCRSDVTTAFAIEFLTEMYSGTDSAKIVNDTIVFNSIFVHSQSGPIIKNDTTFRLELSVDPETERTTFVFDSEIGIDSIELSYTTRARLISELCDALLAIDNFDTVSTTFDSLQILNTRLRTTNDETIRIYR